MERYQKQQELAVSPVWNLSNHSFQLILFSAQVFLEVQSALHLKYKTKLTEFV